jgi:hypothetical protein
MAREMKGRRREGREVLWLVKGIGISGVSFGRWNGAPVIYQVIMVIAFGAELVFDWNVFLALWC